jgi:hypothetical protein
MNTNSKGITGHLPEGVTIIVSITQIKPKKVTYMVGTFLRGNGGGFQISTSQAASEKVAVTVATFLNKDSNYFQIIRVTTKEIVAECVIVLTTKMAFKRWSLR